MTYLEKIAEAIAAELPASDTDQDGMRELLLLYALLAATHGTRVSKRHVHDAWVTWQLLRGEEHEANVPFDELEPDTKGEDEPYREAIIRAAEKLDL